MTSPQPSSAHSFSELDHHMMERALVLAGNGTGSVSPNPLVGCVITNTAGVVLGEGWHKKYGGPHAEVEAVRDAEARGNTLTGSTVYVTLEPCSHYGKTPPCADLLIEKNVGRVVIALMDPNPKVAGQGINRLRQAGITVEVGLLEEEAQEVNRFFLKHITTRLPYITMKIAASLDGKIALKSGESTWFTSEASRKIVHQLRAEHDAVLIGRGTALKDNPALTVRDVDGRNPMRVVLDTNLTLPEKLALFSDDHRNKTIVITTRKTRDEKSEVVRRLEKSGIQIVAIPTTKDRPQLAEVIQQLEERGITSILVEPGASLANSFVRERAFDELQLFLAPRIFGSDAVSAVGPLDLIYINAAPALTLVSNARVADSEDIHLRYRHQS